MAENNGARRAPLARRVRPRIGQINPVTPTIYRSKNPALSQERERGIFFGR